MQLSSLTPAMESNTGCSMLLTQSMVLFILPIRDVTSYTITAVHHIEEMETLVYAPITLVYYGDIRFDYMTSAL